MISINQSELFSPTSKFFPTSGQSRQTSPSQSSLHKGTRGNAKGIIRLKQQLPNISVQQLTDVRNLDQSTPMLLKQLFKDETTNNNNMNDSGVFKPKNILDNDEIMGKISRINSLRKQSVVNSKNLRQVARILGKKNGLNGIGLADIPIMSVELQTIVQTFKEFSKMIEFLSAGYNHQTTSSQDSLENLRISQKVFKYVKNFKGLAMASCDIGNLYLDMKQFRLASQNYHESLVTSLNMQGIRSVESFASSLAVSCHAERKYKEDDQDNISPSFLLEVLDRLFFLGFTVSEMVFELQTTEIQEKQAQSHPLFSQKITRQITIHIIQSLRYFKLCSTILARSLPIKEFKRRFLHTLINLFIANLHSHLGQFDLVNNFYAQAQQHYEALQGSLETNLQLAKDSHIHNQLKIVQNFFYFVKGVSLINKRSFYLGCMDLTMYIENPCIDSFKQKALYYLKVVFEQHNLSLSKILLTERRICSFSSNSQQRQQRHHPYDVFILVYASKHPTKSHSKPKLLSKLSPKIITYQESCPQPQKSLQQSLEKKQKKLNTNVQIRLLQYFISQFVQTDDRLSVAGYSDTERKIIMELSPSDDKIKLNKAVEETTSFLKKPPPHHNPQADQNKINFKPPSRESSLTWLLNQIRLRYQNHSLLQVNPQNPRKIIILFFSPIDNNILFNSSQMSYSSAQEVNYLTTQLPSIPKILNFIQFEKQELSGNQQSNHQYSPLLPQGTSDNSHNFPLPSIAKSITLSEDDSNKESQILEQRDSIISHSEKQQQSYSQSQQFSAYQEIQDNANKLTDLELIKNRSINNSYSSQHIQLKKFFPIFYESQVYAYLSKLRSKQVETHTLFNEIFR